MTKNIFLKRKLIESADYDAVLIAVYTALRSLFTTAEAAVVCVTVNSLCYELVGHLQISRSFRENIQKGLEQLLKLGVITLLEHRGKEFVLDMSNLYIESVKESTGEKEYYVNIESDELHKIYNSNTRMDKFALARLFMVMIASIDFNAKVSDQSDRLVVKHNFVGYMPQEFLAGRAQVAQSSCVAYIAELERLEMIYVFRHPVCILPDGTAKKLNNNYGRKRDKSLIDTYVGVIQGEHYGGTKQHREKEKKANYSRSMSQKYNCFRNGVVYTATEVAEIKAFVEKKNEELQRMIEATNDKYEQARLESRMKDMSIFDKFKEKKENSDLPAGIVSATKEDEYYVEADYCMIDDCGDKHTNTHSQVEKLLEPANPLKQSFVKRKYSEFRWKEMQSIYEKYCEFVDESELAERHNTSVDVIEKIIDEFEEKLMFA